MDESYLYQKIVAAIRRDILQGSLKPGERLPTIRQMTERWNCTIGTVQRAYQELARQGLVVSRPGQGTHVIEAPGPLEDIAIRRASLVHRSETFLLEMLAMGHTPAEIEAGLHQAMERWQVIAQQPRQAERGTLRVVGSHDPALGWLAAHFSEIAPEFTLQVRLTGSLGGLIALAKGEADLAGCHLWDEESNTYNEPFVRRLLPGKRVALLTLAHRCLGLITPPGNPANLKNIVDLSLPNLRFVNRQTGSGTRVWLDVALRKAGMDSRQILGYDDELMTHFEVASAIAEKRADVGFGLETAARSYGLGFIFLVLERYDLVLPAETLEKSPASRLVEWLISAEVKQAIENLGGYEVRETGQLRWIG